VLVNLSKRWLLKRAALAAALVLPAGFVPALMTAPAAHAAVICVGVGTDPLPSGAGLNNPCVPPTPAANVFDVNVCVAQATDDTAPDDSGAPLDITAGPVSAWVNPLSAAPQGELEVIAAGTDTGISSDAVTNGSPC
jgi:hypothetical protein